MDRLLVLRLEAAGCVAEAWLNGLPLARVQPGQALSLPVHEFTCAGANELELSIEPGPPLGLGPPAAPELQPCLSDGKTGASLRLLLPRVGSVAHPASARTLAQLDWAPAEGQVYTRPLRLRERAELPINFPRWRWLDAPVIEEQAGLRPELAAYLLELALGLRRGDAEPLIQASRLRLEELALAYQRELSVDVQRLRQHIQQLHAAQPLLPELPAAAQMLLRPVAGGRLLECLRADGTPLLQSPTAGGGRMAWPLRVARVEGKFYVLR